MRWFWRGAFFAGANETIVLEYLPLFALAFGASNDEIGLLAAGIGLAAMLAFVPGAWLSSRWRYRKPFILATGWGAAQLLFIPLAVVPLLFDVPLAVRFIIALAAMRAFVFSLALPAWTALAADLVPAGMRGRYFSTRNFLYGVGGLAATILLIATNAGMLGMSRLAYSLGRHRQLPPLFSRLHELRGTPAIAIITFTGFASLLVIPGRLDLLAGAYSFGAMLTFSFAHISVIALRIREPSMARPFKIPLNLRLRGREIPLILVIGLIGTMSAWTVVAVSQPLSRYLGLAWMVGGLVLYLLYRRSIHESPLKVLARSPGDQFA